MEDHQEWDAEAREERLLLCQAPQLGPSHRPHIPLKRVVLVDHRHSHLQVPGLLREVPQEDLLEVQDREAHLGHKLKVQEALDPWAHLDQEDLDLEECHLVE